MSIIHISKRENPYAQIDKRVLGDNRLSWRAKGILAYLLSKPSGWKVNVKDIWNNGAEGRNAVQDCLVELQKIGYAELKTVTGEHGKLMGSQWIITEEPKGGFSELTDKPKTGKPTNRKSGSRVYSNNEEDSNNELTTTKEKIDVAVFDPEVNALIVDSLEFKADAFPPTPIAPPPAPQSYGEWMRSDPPAPRRFEAFDIDKEERMFLGAEGAMERYARETGTPREKMYFGFQDAVKAFTADQKTTGYNYNNAIDYRKHFFNLVRRKAEIARNGQRAQPGASASQSNSPVPTNIRRL